MIPPRQEFASDNTAGICPEAAAALAQANADLAPSYGDDEWTCRLCDGVRKLFEIDCDVFLVFNGTAANALALAHLCQPFHSIICHENAHIENDECGACEFYTGGSKLIPTPGPNGKIDLSEVEAALLRQHAPDFVFDAFCTSRLGGAGPQVFGTLPASTAFDPIIRRAMPA